MSQLSYKEQQLFNLVRSLLPSWWWMKASNPHELFMAFAKMFGDAGSGAVPGAQGQLETWLSNTLLTRATGQWQDQNARDRGTTRQLNESDVALGQRLRSVDDAQTVASILAAANAALAVDGVTGSAALVDLRRTRAHLGTNPEDGRRKSFVTSSGQTHPIKYRMSSSASARSFVVILPFGTPSSTQASVKRAVDKKRAAGFVAVVEVRANP